MCGKHVAKLTINFIDKILFFSSSKETNYFLKLSLSPPNGPSLGHTLLTRTGYAQIKTLLHILYVFKIAFSFCKLIKVFFLIFKGDGS